jgi:hypothetical protein
MASETLTGLPEPEQDYDQLERQLDLYEKGRRLRTLTNSPDWELVVQTLQDYRDKYRDALIALPPGDPRVPLAHAAASSSNDIFTYFMGDIQAAVDFTNNPPDEVVASIRGIRRALDVKVAMGQGE